MCRIPRLIVLAVLLASTVFARSGTVALATNGENHGTFDYNGVTYNAYYLMIGRKADSDRYTDLYEFLMAKINQQMLPKLDTLGKGGGWFEGENYGRASKRHLFESLLLLKQTAGREPEARPVARN